MKIKSLEPTPNPNAFKFNLEEELTKRARSFQSVEAAAEDPLARSLFEIEGVDSVFYLGDFVTISKAEGADWEAVMTGVGQRLIDFDIEELVKFNEAHAEEEELDEETATLLGKVNAVIDEMVRPALAGDGGGLEVLSLDGTTLYIRYQGACGSCPSAAKGTLMAIEQLLHHQVSPDLSVVPA